jgi:hypothetical protein
VVVCGETAPLATLVSAPCPLRFEAGDLAAVFAEQDPASSRAFETPFPGWTNGVSVNGSGSAAFSPDWATQLVEVWFESPVPASRFFVGGSIVKPAWKRNWPGGIAEMILLPDAPTEAGRNAILRYLALKYSMKVPTEADGAVQATLSALGIDAGGLFSTVITVR